MSSALRVSSCPVYLKCDRLQPNRSSTICNLRAVALRHVAYYSTKYWVHLQHTSNSRSDPQNYRLNEYFPLNQRWPTSLVLRATFLSDRPANTGNPEYRQTGRLAQLIMTSLSMRAVCDSLPAGPVKADSVSSPLRCFFGFEAVLA